MCVFLCGNIYGLTIIWTGEKTGNSPTHLATMKMDIMRWPEPARIFSSLVKGLLRRVSKTSIFEPM